MKKVSLCSWLLCGLFMAWVTLGGLPGFPLHAAHAAKAKKMTHVMILGSRVGHPSQALAEAWANFINKKSSWLRATAVPTAGYTASYELAMENPTKYLLTSADLSNLVGLSRDPAYKYYNKMRIMASCISMTYLLVTYDKNIKTYADLAGKRIGIARKGAIIYPWEKDLMKAHGVTNDSKLIAGGWGTLVNELKDGVIDAAIMAINHIYPCTFGKGTFITELETKGPIYYISFDPAKFKSVMKKLGPMSLLVRIPAGRLDPKTQPNALWAGSYPDFFGADVRMDPKVVYEATKIIWETRGQWGTWNKMGASINARFIPSYPLSPKYVSPAAKKFYDDHGIKMRNIADLLAGCSGSTP